MATAPNVSIEEQPSLESLLEQLVLINAASPATAYSFKRPSLMESRLFHEKEDRGTRQYLDKRTNTSVAQNFISAADDGRIDDVKRHLEGGKLRVDVIEYGQTALIAAADKGHKDICKLLISRGCNIDIKDNYGYNALMIASLYGHTEICELLISHGCNVGATDKNGNTALILAVLERRKDVCNLLISHVHNINTQNKKACDMDRSLMLFDLLSNEIYGAYTALMIATENGDFEICDSLIQHGSNVDLCNERGDTALILAAERGHHNICKLLISHGCSIDTQNGNGDTALTLAANRGDLSIVFTLIEAGCNYYLKNKRGKTALDILKEEYPDKLNEVQAKIALNMVIGSSKIVISDVYLGNDIDINGTYHRRAYDGHNGQIEIEYRCEEKKDVVLQYHEKFGQYDVKYGVDATAPVARIKESTNGELSLLPLPSTTRQAREVNGGSIAYLSGNEFRGKSKPSWVKYGSNEVVWCHKTPNCILKEAFNSTSIPEVKEAIISIGKLAENFYPGTTSLNKIDSAAELAIADGTASAKHIKLKGNQMLESFKDILFALPEADKAVAAVVKAGIEYTGPRGSTLPGESDYPKIFSNNKFTKALSQHEHTNKMLSTAKCVHNTIQSGKGMLVGVSDNGDALFVGKLGGHKVHNSNGGFSYLPSCREKVVGSIPAGTTVFGPRGGEKVMSKYGNLYYKKK